MMKNTLGNELEHLVKGLGNIWRNIHPSSTSHKIKVEEHSRYVGVQLCYNHQRVNLHKIQQPHTANRNIGKYKRPHIWDSVLFTTPEL